MIISKENKPKKKKGMSRVLVPFIVISIFIFTGVAIWLQYRTGVELSSTLIMSFFGFCSSELFMLAGIKKTKVKNDYNTNNNDEEAQG